MKPSGWFFLLLVLAAVVIAVILYRRKAANTPGVAASQTTIVIRPKGNAGKVDNPTVKVGSQIRWVDTSGHPYQMMFDRAPWALVEGPGPHDVPANGHSPKWYTVASVPAGTYTYHSATTPLEGPPGEPGLIIED